MSINIHPTKYAIMEAAIKIFSQKGFSGATTKEIAQEAGVAEGTIFRHFPTKSAILYGIVDSFIPMLGVESLEQTLNECREMDRETALRYIVQNRFDTIQTGKDLIKIILTEVQYDTNLREMYMERVYHPIQQLLNDFFNARISQGDYRQVDPRLIANLFLSFVLFYIGNQYYLGDALQYKFDAKELTDVLLNGIKGE